MNIKKYLIALGYTFTSIIGFTIFITIFNYFDILNPSILKVLKIIISIIAMFIGGFIIGKKSDKKGYLEGIKLGIIYIIIIFLLSILGLSNFKFSKLLFYLMLILSSSIGSMFGINKNTKE